MSSHANDFKKWKKSRILRQTDFELLVICVVNSIHFNTNFGKPHTVSWRKKIILLCLFVIIHCFSYQWFVVNIFYYYGFFGMHFFEFLIFFFKIFISIYSSYRAIILKISSMCFWRLHLFFNKNYLRCLPLHKVLTIKKKIHETKVKNLTLKSRQFFLNNVFLKNIRDPSVAILKTFDYSSTILSGQANNF